MPPFRTIKQAWLITAPASNFAHEQVRVAVHHPVIALREKVFKPLLETAYYSPSAFHFDLTKAEALSLLEAFTHRQVRAPDRPTGIYRSCAWGMCINLM